MKDSIPYCSVVSIHFAWNIMHISFHIIIMSGKEREQLVACSSIAETAMGKQLHVQRIKDSPYVRAVYG